MRFREIEPGTEVPPLALDDECPGLLRLSFGESCIETTHKFGRTCIARLRTVQGRPPDSLGRLHMDWR